MRYLFSKVCLLILAVMTLLFSCTPNNDTLRIGICADNGQYSSVKDGKFYGYEIELAERLAKSMKKQYKFIDMDFSGLINAVQNGDIDIALACINKTPEREKIVSFSNEYLGIETLLLITTDTTLPDEIDSIEELDKDNKDIFVTQVGSTYLDWINQKIKNGTSKPIEKLFQINQIIDDAEKNDKIHCLFDAEAIKIFNKNNKLSKKIKVIKIKNFDFPYGYAIVISKINKELLDQINLYLNSNYKKDKQELQKKFFDSPFISSSIHGVDALQMTQTT